MISPDLMDPPIRLVLITSVYIIGILIRYIGWSDIKPPMNYGCTRNKEIRDNCSQIWRSSIMYFCQVMLSRFVFHTRKKCIFRQRFDNSHVMTLFYRHWNTAIYIYFLITSVYIKFSAHDTLLESLSSGTLKVYKFENQIM